MWRGKRRQVEREGEYGVKDEMRLDWMGWHGMAWHQARGREGRVRSVFQVRSGRRMNN